MGDRSEWLAWRQKGIGASDAAALYDAHPYMTKKELYKVKRQKDFKEDTSNQFVKDRGNNLEPIARARFEAIYNIENGTQETFEPKRVEIKDLDFIRASLDGCSKDGTVLAEFKFMSKPIEKGKELTKGQTAHVEVLKGAVPHHYWIQMQHQLLASGASKCYFVSFDGESLHSTCVIPDIEFQKKHIAVCTEFWKSVQDGTEPEASADDVVSIDDKEMKAKCKRWKTLKCKLDEIEKEMEELRNDVLQNVTHPHSVCAGVVFTRVAGRAGAVDYKKIMALPDVIALKINVDKYKKPDGKESWKMEVV